jgi:hypothetical protein
VNLHPLEEDLPGGISGCENFTFWFSLAIVALFKTTQSPHRLPWARNYIICRGIECRQTSADVADRDGPFHRVAAVVKETRTFFCDWELTPNPLHLLLRTGAPIDAHGKKSWRSSFPLLK